jgi:4-hydroxy-4-methyl-2-oxoglutarate aldolase
VSTNTQNQTPTTPAEREMIEKFLHPRMTTEHIWSGGGLCMSNRIRSMLPGKRFVGRALTARTLAGFTRAGQEALAQAQPGDVLVIAAGGPSELSPWGGMVHWNATRDKLAGVVVDGPTRDMVEIKALENAIPLFACGQAPAIAGFGAPTTGAIRETVMCGGIPVSTGDLVFGDDDGVAVVPWAKVEQVLDLALKGIIFDDKEQAWVESGRSVFDLLTMLSGVDGSNYKERKFRWVSQTGIEPLKD